VVGALFYVRRTHASPFRAGSWMNAGRAAALLFLACETAFLVAAGAPTFSSSPSYLTTNPNVVALQRAVGSSVVGMGSPCHRNQLGIYLNVNIAYQVQEFGAYDPIVPSKYITSWNTTNRKHPLSTRQLSDTFCPAVTTASAARKFGIGFVLERSGHRGPKGAVLDKRIGGEDLYRIPGAAAATLTPLQSSGQSQRASSRATPVTVDHPGPASWKLVTHASTPQFLRLRLTNTPGWHASIDGQPLNLTSYGGVMLQARIPAGRHVVEVHYWPDTFSLGLVLAACSAIGLVFAVTFGWFRRRRSTSAVPPHGPTTS